MKMYFESTDFKDQMETPYEFKWQEMADFCNAKLAEIKAAWLDQFVIEQDAEAKAQWLAELKANATVVYGEKMESGAFIWCKPSDTVEPHTHLVGPTHRAHLIGIEEIEKEKDMFEPKVSISVFGMNEHQIKQCMDFYVAHHGALPEAEEIKPKDELRECVHEPPSGLITYPPYSPSALAHCKHCGVKLRARWEVVE